jgi:uncharacterized membrane protein
MPSLSGLNPRRAAERWWGALRATPGSSLAERTAALNAAASIGQTFSRGLQPRSSGDQAIAAAVTAAITYDLSVTLQTAVETVAWRVAGAKPSSEQQASQLYAMGSAAAMLAGFGAQVVAAQGQDTITKATVRSVGWKVAASGAIGIAGVAGLEVARRTPGLRRISEYPFALEIPAGVAASLARMEVQRLRRAQLEGTQPNFRFVVGHLGRASVEGVAIGGGVLGLLAAEGAVARVVSRGVGKAVPPAAGIGPLVGHGVALGMLGAAGFAALRWQSQSIEQRNGSVESAYAKPPENDFASTGPRSVVSFDHIGKEGRRFAVMRLPASDIEAVMDEPAVEPVRVVSGIKSGKTAEDRVAVALEEMDRLDAFKRKYICIGVPTGVGYVSYTFTEALEYFTRGDCASVLVQYALRPSALALNAVVSGAAQNRLLVQRISERLASMPEANRPKLLVFGESLGAMVALNSTEPEGVDFLKYTEVNAALFYGSPYWSALVLGRSYRPGPVDAFGHMIIAPGMDELMEASPQRGSTRYLAISHFDDPIPKFTLRLAVQAPTWMGAPATRPPGVPRETKWRPLNTLILTLVDVKNGMDFRPGIFVPRGHDYRYDSARSVLWTFDLPASPEQLQRVERALRLREQEWAQRRLGARQLNKARRALRGRIENWGRVPDPVMGKLRPMLDEVVESATRSVAELIDSDLPTPGTGAVS